jgi:hypothetical protein
LNRQDALLVLAQHTLEVHERIARQQKRIAWLQDRQHTTEMSEQVLGSLQESAAIRERWLFLLTAEEQPVIPLTPLFHQAD